MKRKKLLLMAFIFSAITSLHALPFLWTFNPFSTDVWPLIRISERLISEPQVKIFNDTALDGYNNRWPGVSIASALVSEVTGIELLSVYGLLLMIALNASIFTLAYSLSKRLGGSILSAVAMAAVPSFLIFTSSTLKEVYSYPLLLAVAASILFTSTIRRTALLLLLISLSQVITHHLSTAMGIAIFANVLALEAINRLKGSKEPSQMIIKSALYISIAGTAFLFYFYFLGSRTLFSAVSYGDIAIASLYIFFFDSITLLSYRGRSSWKWKGFSFSAISLLLLAFAYKFSIGSYSYDFSSVLSYGIGLALLLSIPREESELSKATALSVAGITSFIAFSKPELGGIIHRVLNYLAFYLGFSKIKESKIAFAVAFIGVVISAFVMAQLLLGWDKVSFYWLYSNEDVEAGNALKSFNGGSRIVADAKLYYLENMELPIDSGALFKLLYGNYNCNGSIIVVSSDNIEKGFAEGSSIYKITEAMIGALSKSSTIFSMPSYKFFWCGK